MAQVRSRSCSALCTCMAHSPGASRCGPCRADGLSSHSPLQRLDFVHMRSAQMASEHGLLPSASRAAAHWAISACSTNGASISAQATRYAASGAGKREARKRGACGDSGTHGGHAPVARGGGHTSRARRSERAEGGKEGGGGAWRATHAAWAARGAAGVQCMLHEELQVCNACC
jgi:hypothetical protein